MIDYTLGRVLDLFDFDMDLEDEVDAAFAALTELFSKPIKNSQRYRRYELSFRNGEPVFELSEVDRWFDEIIGSDPEEE